MLMLLLCSSRSCSCSNKNHLGKLCRILRYDLSILMRRSCRESDKVVPGRTI